MARWSFPDADFRTIKNKSLFITSCLVSGISPQQCKSYSEIPTFTIVLPSSNLIALFYNTFNYRIFPKLQIHYDRNEVKFLCSYLFGACIVCVAINVNQFSTTEEQHLNDRSSGNGCTREGLVASRFQLVTGISQQIL